MAYGQNAPSCDPLRKYFMIQQKSTSTTVKKSQASKCYLDHLSTM